MSKWRRLQKAWGVAVVRDGLMQCGLYPFRVYDFREIAYQKRIEAAKKSGVFGDIMKAVYGGKDADRSFAAMCPPTSPILARMFGLIEPTEIERHAYQSRRFVKRRWSKVSE